MGRFEVSWAFRGGMGLRDAPRRSGPPVQEETAVEAVEAPRIAVDGDYLVIKEERMPDGKTKRILKERASGRIVQRIY